MYKLNEKERKIERMKENIKIARIEIEIDLYNDIPISKVIDEVLNNFDRNDYEVKVKGKNEFIIVELSTSKKYIDFVRDIHIASKDIRFKEKHYDFLICLN